MAEVDDYLIIHAVDMTGVAGRSSLVVGSSFLTRTECGRNATTHFSVQAPDTGGERVVVTGQIAMLSVTQADAISTARAWLKAALPADVDVRWSTAEAEGERSALVDAFMFTLSDPTSAA